MATTNDVFATTLEHHFPGSMPEAEFVANTAELLVRQGFTVDNTLAAVAVCRDEIARTLFTDVEERWGPTFSLASLAGMATAGRTGLSAALSHAPTDNGPKHLVVYAMPHIAIDRDGTIGQVRRLGVSEPSSACGSLAALRSSLLGGHTQIGVDRFDSEQSLLSHRLKPMIGHDDVPDLVNLTKLAAADIEEDLSEIMEEVLTHPDDKSAPPPNGASFTGIQIHGPDDANYVWPRMALLVIDGIRRDIASEL